MFRSYCGGYQAVVERVCIQSSTFYFIQIFQLLLSPIHHLTIPSNPPFIYLPTSFSFLCSYYFEDESVDATTLTNAQLAEILDPTTDSYRDLTNFVYEVPRAKMMCFISFLTHLLSHIYTHFRHNLSSIFFIYSSLTYLYLYL